MKSEGGSSVEENPELTLAKRNRTEKKTTVVKRFDALARRRNITGEVINGDQLKEFWEQINDQSFDSRLKTFFDMVDKDADGRLTEDEVREIISLSASADSLSTIQRRAGEHAAMIMEELDPDNIGYITLESLETLVFANGDTVCNNKY